MKTLCIYCGSSIGASPVYASAARAMAAEMARRKISLVYGGGNVGLMGVIADEMMKLGGDVTGVIPEALLDREIGHIGITRQLVVNDMHERKAMMAELSDGFIAMPGGIGTLEELFEALTWSQIGFHRKPVGLLNVQGFYDGLIVFIRHLVAEGFLKREQATLLIDAADPTSLLEKFDAYRPDEHRRVLDTETARSILP